MNAVTNEAALQALRNKCAEVSSAEEAEVIVRSLESAIKGFLGKNKHVSLSAPQANIQKQVAIIRTPEVSIDLINPKIIQKKNKIISYGETCLSFKDAKVNCRRYKEIVIENGLHKKQFTFTGQAAILIQHEIDHMNGTLIFDKTIKLALARLNGEIKERDFCPCASKKRFFDCCLMKDE